MTRTFAKDWDIRPGIEDLNREVLGKIRERVGPVRYGKMIYCADGDTMLLDMRTLDAGRSAGENADRIITRYEEISS